MSITARESTTPIPMTFTRSDVMVRKVEPALTRMLRTGTSGASRHRPGFTTIELLVVLVIVVIMSGLAALSMGPALADARMRAGCRMVASAINYARSHAASSNTTTRVVFEDDHSVEVAVVADSTTATQDTNADQQMTVLTTAGGKHQTFPDGVRITGIAKAGNVVDENWLEFSKLGETDKTLIELSDAHDQKKYVALDPITGRCKIRNYEDEIKDEAADSAQIVK